MTVQKIISRLYELRAVLVVAALISLCVSNNVGPSFLLLPVASSRVAEQPQERQRDKASRTPSPTGSDSFRVPMRGHTQKRAAKEPQPQPLAMTVKAGLVTPNDERINAGLDLPFSLLTSALVSQPPGRGPPRLD